MCGVTAARRLIASQVEASVVALSHRGPDAQGLVERGLVVLGHDRLAIIDLDHRSDQPFVRGDVALSYNGELWNFRELRADLVGLGHAFQTTGDTEVVAAALQEWGDEALPRMEGMFALAWTSCGEVLHLARDRFGEVPLHWWTDGSRAFAASEMKGFRAAGLSPSEGDMLPPGHLASVGPDGCVRCVRWYEPSCAPRLQSRGLAAARLALLMDRGARERVMSDVPVCVLLSGGIDSSAVCATLLRYAPSLVAYTAVLDERSPDLRAAREVAEHLGVELREVRVPTPTAQDLSAVVEAIEMPHKAQVEIAHACLHLARRIREDGIKVVFSGEGSDELWASYGFSYYGVARDGWHPYRKRLFLEQHRKNFARCNKAFLAYGVECRLPFLHTCLVEHALSLPEDAVRDGRSRPKAVLQDALAGVIPDALLSRRKLAFQDGMGLKDAAASAVSDPRRFYDAEFRKRYGG